jgi:hypothetical protein
MKQTNEHIYTQTRTHTQYGNLIKCTFQARAHSILPQVIISFVMSFLPSSCRHRTTAGKTFAKMYIGNFYENLVHLFLISDKYNRHFTLKRKYIYDISPFTRLVQEIRYIAVYEGGRTCKKYSRTRKSEEKLKYGNITFRNMRDLRLSPRCSSDIRFIGLFYGVVWFVTTYKTNALLLEILTIEYRKDRLYRNFGGKSISATTQKNEELIL